MTRGELKLFKGPAPGGSRRSSRYNTPAQQREDSFRHEIVGYKGHGLVTRREQRNGSYDGSGPQANMNATLYSAPVRHTAAIKYIPVTGGGCTGRLSKSRQNS